MAKFCGKDFVVQIEDSPAGSDTFTTVAAMRSTSMSVNNEQVDVTTKSDMSWRQLIACGVRTMSISLAGVVTDDDTFKQLQANAISDTDNIWAFKLVSGLGDEFKGNYQIASIERTGEYNGAEEYSITLEGAGEIAYTAPT